MSGAAYMPTVGATFQRSRTEAALDVYDHANFSSNSRNGTQASTIALAWVLYDFGSRAAGLRNAKELLLAAQANQAAALQTVFATVAKDYYAAQGAQDVVRATIEVELSAKGSFVAASMRFNKGIAPITDVLGAHAAYALATLNRAKAQGEWRSEVGVLAADMNLHPDVPLELPEVQDSVQSREEFSDSISEILVQAQQNHPSVLEATAQLRAAEAKVDQVTALGRPSISLTAKSSRNNQPISPGLGETPLASKGRDWVAGIQVTIPLFEGLERTYQITQARAQVEAQEVVLDQIKTQVGLDVWTGFQSLQTASQSLINSRELLDIAVAFQRASSDRYIAGVGTIVELLDSQSALANARRQRAQALVDWRAARMQLAARIGKATVLK